MDAEAAEVAAGGEMSVSSSARPKGLAYREDTGNEEPNGDRHDTRQRWV